MRNLVICFPGGTGGHFITSVCSSILYGTTITVDDNGSCHGWQGYKKLSAFVNRLMNKTKFSYDQELETIKSLGNFDITLGHFRYLDLLTEHNKKCIYITFEEDDKPLIYKKLHSKANLMSITKQDYEYIMGADWPSYSEFLQGNIHTEFIDIRFKNDWLADWFYVLPSNLKNVCEITFKEIYFGNNLIHKLCSFLNCDNNIDKTLELIKNYRSKQ